jgi:hypothetical protein
MIGMTGIGKSTFASRIARPLLDNVYANRASSEIPYISIPAPADGQENFSWATLYEKILIQANEIMVDKKLSITKNANFFKFESGNKKLPSLRASVESTFKCRNVRLLSIDESVHFLRFNEYAPVMDTLKSIADVGPTKVLLTGAYDLVDLVTDYGQTCRRTEILHYRRYHSNNKKDVESFNTALGKLQRKWPSQNIPNLTAISTELMQASFGCVGILKDILVVTLLLQLHDPEEKWRPAFLKKATKSLLLSKNIREETEAGEEKIQEALYGDSLVFHDKALALIAQKMEIQQ